MNRGCHAPWYELNISAPDNEVSACCYYRGPKDPWTDRPAELSSYWNGGHFQTVRKANMASGEGQPSGCDSCHYFKNRESRPKYFAEFLTPTGDLSPEQDENWKRAIDDFQNERTEATCKPLRYYVNFGFSCNISCIQCHQVPRRVDNRRQVSSDVFWKWREHFKSALGVSVIGGEPFVLKECLSFIQRFIEDPELKKVRLYIFTNGTLHHRHMDLLSKKENLSLVVSLDSIEEAYEKIRVGASWEQVRSNIDLFKKRGKELGFDWRLTATSGLMKTGVRKLPRFAEWSVENDIPLDIFEIISARGVELAVQDENILEHPLLLKSIPDWESYFTRAAAIFQEGKMPAPSQLLVYYRDLLSKKIKDAEARQAELEQTRKTAAWKEFVRFDASQVKLYLAPALYGRTEAPYGIQQNGEELILTPDHLNDHIASRFFDLEYTGAKKETYLKVQANWPTNAQEPFALFLLQDQAYREIPKVHYAENASKGMVAYFAKLTPDISSVRLLFQSPEKQVSVLPDSIALSLVDDGARLQVKTLKRDALKKKTRLSSVLDFFKSRKKDHA